MPTKRKAGIPPNRELWKDKPIDERIAFANQLLVLHPRFREAVEVLRRCHQSKFAGGEPRCGAILGASGAGKTSVVQHYHRLHPREETDTATRQPVIQVTLQPDARPKGIATDILFALEDPAWSSGTVQTLTNRAFKLLERCGVELIVFDEFHHLFDMDRLKVMTKASQWLKVLIVNTRIPVVVCGMTKAEHVLREEHTERRFKERVTLNCFSWRSTPGRREFCGMLKKLDDSLPLALSSGLAEKELSGRFCLASRGVPDYLMTLVRGAVAEALRRGSEQIEASDLARVYASSLAQQRVLLEQDNPFVGPVQQSALDRVQPADQLRTKGGGLTPRAAVKRKKKPTASDYLGGR